MSNGICQLNSRPLLDGFNPMGTIPIPPTGYQNPILNPMNPNPYIMTNPQCWPNCNPPPNLCMGPQCFPPPPPDPCVLNPALCGQPIMNPNPSGGCTTPGCQPILMPPPSPVYTTGPQQPIHVTTSITNPVINPTQPIGPQFPILPTPPSGPAPSGGFLNPSNYDYYSDYLASVIKALDVSQQQISRMLQNVGGIGGTLPPLGGAGGFGPTSPGA